MNEILSPENYTSIFNLIIEFAPRILLGIVFLFIGLRIIKRSNNVLEKFLNSKKICLLNTTDAADYRKRV